MYHHSLLWKARTARHYPWPAAASLPLPFSTRAPVQVCSFRVKTGGLSWTWQWSFLGLRTGIATWTHGSRQQWWGKYLCRAARLRGLCGFTETPPLALHSQPTCAGRLWEGKASISSPLATAALGLHSPRGTCISSKHGLSLVCGSGKKKDLFFILVTDGPSSASQMLHFQHGEKLLEACGADGVLICMYNLKEREKTLCGEAFTWKELVCSALISAVWLTLSGDKPNVLLLYLWGQAAEVISILQRGGKCARQGYYPSLKVPLEWQLGF